MPHAHIIPLVPADVLWITRCPVPTATAIALHHGWFDAAYAEAGFRVQTLQETADPLLRSQGFYHDLKTLFREGGNVPAFAARARGHDHTVVIGLTWVDEVQLLLARPQSGLVRGDLSALKGTVLGVSKGGEPVDIWRAMALRGYDTALKLGGLSFDDVTVKDVRAPDRRFTPGQRGATWSESSEQALLLGEVDLIYAKGAPAIALQQKHGLDVVLDINQIAKPAYRINNGTPRPITVHRHLLNDRPDLVVEYLRILQRAADWSKQNADQVAAIIAQETGTTPEDVVAGYGAGLAAHFDVSLSEERIKAFQDQGDFLYRHGLIETRVDVNHWIDPIPLLTASALKTSDPLLLATQG